MDPDSSTKFIGSLTKFLQSLCNGYVEFEDGVELIGHIYLSVDGKSGKKIDYILNEKVCKSDNSVTFISNSFHALPEAKAKAASGKEGDAKKDDGEVSDSGDSIPKSTNTGTIPSRASQSSRSAPSPTQNRSGVQTGTKRPGSPLKGPTPPQRRAPTPPSQRRIQSSAAKGSAGSPASKTVPSSPSSSSQDNIPSPSPARKNRIETSQPPSNQSDNAGADNESDSLVPPNIMSINPPPDFASFLGSLTSDNQTSARDQRSPQRDTKPDTDVTFIKEEFVSEPSSCAQAGSSGQHSGRSGDEHLDSSGLYPVMLHQNTSVFPSTSAGYPPGFPGGASATATSQQPGFPGTSTSQSDLFNPVPGTSQDGADPSDDDDVQAVFVTSAEDPDVCFYVTTTRTAARPHQGGHESPQDIEYFIPVSAPVPHASSTGAVAVNYDIRSPVFSSVTASEPTSVSMSSSQQDGSGRSYGPASFSFQQPSTSFSSNPSAEFSAFRTYNPSSFTNPQPETVDFKYDVSYLLSMSAQDETAFKPRAARRGPGRPRGAGASRRAYGSGRGRKHAADPHKLSEAGEQAVVSPSSSRGAGRPRKTLARAYRGAGRGGPQSTTAQSGRKTEAPAGAAGRSSAEQATGPFAGAARSRRAPTLASRGRRGGLQTTPTRLQRGRGFRGLQTALARKYRGRAVHSSFRGGARRGAGRPPKTSSSSDRGRGDRWIQSIRLKSQRGRVAIQSTGDRGGVSSSVQPARGRVANQSASRRGGALPSTEPARGRVAIQSAIGRGGVNASAQSARGKGGVWTRTAQGRRGGLRAGRGKASRGRGVSRTSTTSAEEKSDETSDEESDGEAGRVGPHACSKCGKRYSYYVWLKRHRLQCQGGKVFQCVLCEKKFFRKGIFKLHAMSRHGCRATDVMTLRKAQ